MLFNEHALEQLTPLHFPIFQDPWDLSYLYEDATACRHDEPEPVPTPKGASVGPFDVSEAQYPPRMQTRPIVTNLHCNECGYLARTRSDFKWALILLLSDRCLTILGNTMFDMKANIIAKLSHVVGITRASLQAMTLTAT
jgi:hypothetical protein